MLFLVTAPAKTGSSLANAILVPQKNSFAVFAKTKVVFDRFFDPKCSGQHFQRLPLKIALGLREFPLCKVYDKLTAKHQASVACA